LHPQLFKLKYKVEGVILFFSYKLPFVLGMLHDVRMEGIHYSLAAEDVKDRHEISLRYITKLNGRMKQECTGWCQRYKIPVTQLYLTLPNPFQKP